MNLYVVKPGDALWKIAQSYGVSVSQLVTVNQLTDPNQLVVGQSLIIPTTGTKYVVQSGDSLWKISQQFGVNISNLLQINGITQPKNLSPGTLLTIPSKTYTIHSGDTLWKIAQRYGITVSALIQANPFQDPNEITPGTVITLPLPKPVIDVNAYTISAGDVGASLIQAVANDLTYSAFFAYTINADGSLNTVNDNAIIQTSYKNRIVPMMCITNFSSTTPGSQLVHIILSDSTLQDQLVTTILNTMNQKGYLGLNVDFENVLPEDKDAYNTFLQKVVDRLHLENYFVSSALAPKTSGTQKGLLYEAHDYPAHGRILDFVVLMTYEWGYRKGPPQAISPVDQMKRVLDYAVTVIPPEKIFMGFQIYGRDWGLPHAQGQEAETFSEQEAVKRAIQNHATIQFDSTSQSPYFNYTDAEGQQHQVWFEDARSAQAKFNLFKSYNLRGISYWTLGYPFPQNWVLLEDNFTIRKRI